MPAVGQAVREQIKVEAEPETYWGVPSTTATNRKTIPVTNPSFRTADSVWSDEGLRGIPARDFTFVKTPGMGEFSYEFPAYPDLLGMHMLAMMGTEKGTAPAADTGVRQVVEVWFGTSQDSASARASKKFKLGTKLGTAAKITSGELTFSTAGVPPSAATIQTLLRKTTANNGWNIAVDVDGAGTFEDPYIIRYPVHTAATQYVVSIEGATSSDDDLPATLVENVRTLRPGAPVDSSLYLHTFEQLGGGFDPTGVPNTTLPPSLTFWYGQGVRVDRYDGARLSKLELSWNAGESAVMCSVEGQSQRLTPVSAQLDSTNKENSFQNGADDDSNIGKAPMMGFTSSVLRAGQFRGRIMSATHTFSRDLSVIHTGDGSESLEPEDIRSGGMSLRSNFVLNYVSEDDLKPYLDDVKESFEVRFAAPGRKELLRIKSNRIVYSVEPYSEDIGEAAPRLNLSVAHEFNTTNKGACVVELVDTRSTLY